MTLPVKPLLKLTLNYNANASITQAFTRRQLVYLLLVLVLAFDSPVFAGNSATQAEREQFEIAWDAAERGDHDSFRQIKDDLQDYVLFPYLQYEDYRHRRSKVPVGEMVGFLETHQDWAFSQGLKNAWLRSLAKKGRWTDLVAHSEGVSNTVLRCQRVRGQIILKQTEGVLNEAQKLWVVGRSQPDECDPVFAWLVKNDGIPQSSHGKGSAWRSRLATAA